MVRTEAFAPAVIAHASEAKASRSEDRFTAADDPAAVPTTLVVTIAPPTTAAPSTTAAPRLIAHHYAATTTPTTAPKPRPKPAPRTTPTTSSPAPQGSQAPAPSSSSAPPSDDHTGKASWYDEAPPGTCAHRTLPFGTIVTITDLATGKTAQCKVEDRGPFVDGYIIDLSKDVFSQLAPLSQGVIEVRIDW